MGFWNNFTERIKLSQKIRKSLEPKPNIVNLAIAIFEISQKVTSLLNEYILKSFPNDSQEYLYMQLHIFFEVATFYAHFASRIALKKFGHEKRQILNNHIGTLLVDYIISNFYEPISNDPQFKLPNEFRNKFFNYLNQSEYEYGSCRAWILKEDEDIAFADKFAGGLKSNGMLNLLTDNIVKILNNYNPVSYHLIMGILVSFNVKEFENVVLKTQSEL